MAESEGRFPKSGAAPGLAVEAAQRRKAHRSERDKRGARPKPDPPERVLVSVLSARSRLRRRRPSETARTAR
jgi:hypothetical protein